MNTGPRLLLGSVACWLHGQSTIPGDPGAAAVVLRSDGASEVRTIRANLDDDPEQEAIVVASGKGALQPPLAIVFDRQDGGWRRVAEFDGGRHWMNKGTERFLRIRSTVSKDRQDLIVRDANGGTGIFGTYLTVHRMRNGKLHEVFSAVESEESRPDHKQETVLDAATFDFQPPRIVERRREIREPDLPSSASPPRQIDTCGVFQWSEQEFRFMPDPTATRRERLPRR